MGIEIPDPPKDAIDMTAAEVNPQLDGMVQGGESDSDDGPNDDHLGYAPLSMDPSHQPPSFSDSDDERDEADETPETPELSSTALASDSPTTSDFDRATVTEISEVWNAPRVDKANPMDSEHAAKILKAMEGFSLPASATPSWAKGMSDEDWKKHVSDKILNSKP